MAIPEDSEALLLRRSHPDSAETVFSWRPSSSETLSQDAWVSLDTNVLLFPYREAKESLSVIAEIYSNLASEGRLVIAGQVAREYAKNRPTVMANLIQELSKLESSTKIPNLARYPLLSDLTEYATAREAGALAEQHVTSYREALSALTKAARKLAANDPVLETYRSAFREATIVDPEFDESEILQELSHRSRHKLPPGYKDSSKEDGGVGDILIWRTLLEVATESGRDLFFVTQEKKADWWHLADRSPLIPRYELSDAYRRASGGGTLHLMTLSQLLELRGASETVIERVRSRERLTTVDTVRNAVLVEDGQTLLVRGDAGFGLLQPLHQFSVESGQEILHYQSWFGSDVAELRRQASESEPHMGKTAEGSGLPTGMTIIGPYLVPWSFSGHHRGWFYYHEGHSDVADAPPYELAVAPAGTIDWEYFTEGVFQRGDIRP